MYIFTSIPRFTSEGGCPSSVGERVHTRHKGSSDRKHGESPFLNSRHFPYRGEGYDNMS